MAAQAGLCLTWSENPEDRFSCDEAHLKKNGTMKKITSSTVSFLEVFFFKYHITYELMKDLVKQQMSTPLYADLLPRSKDWILVNER